MFVHLFQLILNFLYVCQCVSWLTSLLKLYKYSDISTSGRDNFLRYFGDIPRMFLHKLQIISYLLRGHQSISWLAFLLKLEKYRDISSSVWDIFLKFFGGITGMFVHLFQIILNFMYVCQSVSWLTSLLKLYKYRDISTSGRDIFLKFSGDIPGMFIH